MPSSLASDASNKGALSSGGGSAGGNGSGGEGGGAGGDEGGGGGLAMSTPIDGQHWELHAPAPAAPVPVAVDVDELFVVLDELFVTGPEPYELSSF